MKNVLCIAALAALAGTAVANDQVGQTISISENASLLRQQYSGDRVAGFNVWNTMYGAGPSTTGGSPRTFIGSAVGSLGNASGAGPITLTGLDAVMVNTTGAALNGITAIRLNMTFWGAYGTGTAGTDLIFASLITQASVDFNLATPLNLATNTYIPVGNDFAAGPSAANAGVDLTALNIVLPSLTSLAGVTFNWQVNQGAGFVATQAGLTTGLITGQGPQTVGTNGFALPAGGFLRNAGPRASGYADGNFLNTDGRSFATTDTSVAYRLYATPTPGAASLLGLAGLVAARRRRA